MMTHRDRVLAAMGRRVPDRVPMDFRLCPSQLERFRKETGARDPADYFGFGARYVEAGPTRRCTDFSRYLPGNIANMRVDEWGVGSYTTPSSMHFTHLVHPLQRAENAAEIERYPFPDLDAEYRCDGLSAKVAVLRAAGYAVIGNAVPLGGTIFWPAYKLRGMQEFLMDLLVNPMIAGALLERVASLVSVLAGKLAAADVDILRLGDDLGTQQGPMMSPALFRQWILPGLRRVIASAKKVKPDILVFLHSDGDIRAFIPDLIAIGVDILNPVQPECMDPAEMKRLFGDRLAFWGTVGTQTTMPFGTPEEVKAVVKERIATVGQGGGLLIAPTHLIEPEVPWENIMAFVEAVEKYGYY